MSVLVVVPTHDRTEFIDDALSSVGRQVLPPDSVVVTGNCGPVMPPAWISVALNQDTFAERINRAIAASHCDRFVLLCDDDALHPEFLSKTVAEMERTGADIVYTDLQRFGGAHHVMGALPWTAEQIELTTVPFITSLCRKSAWQRAGGYADVPFSDWDFWWRCFHSGSTAVHLPEPLFLYREHPGQAQYRENLDESRRIILERHNRIRAQVRAGVYQGWSCPSQPGCK